MLPPFFHSWIQNVKKNPGCTYDGFLKWWYPTTMGFPTKNDLFGMFRGYHHLRKHPYDGLTEEYSFSEISANHLNIFDPNDVPNGR